MYHLKKHVVEMIWKHWMVFWNVYILDLSFIPVRRTRYLAIIPQDLSWEMKNSIPPLQSCIVDSINRLFPNIYIKLNRTPTWRDINQSITAFTIMTFQCCFSELRATQDPAGTVKLSWIIIIIPSTCNFSVQHTLLY